MTIRVSTQEIQNQIENFASAVNTLQTIHSNLTRVFNVVTKVSWILSPASLAMAAKIRAKLAKFEVAIRAMQAQATMLTNALNAIREVENLASSKVEALRSNAFTH